MAAIEDPGGAVYPVLQHADVPFSGATAISRPFLVGLVDGHFFCLLHVFGNQGRVIDVLAQRSGAAELYHGSPSWAAADRVRNQQIRRDGSSAAAQRMAGTPALGFYPTIVERMHPNRLHTNWVRV